MYQKQKYAKITTAAAAKADAPTKQTGSTCDKCGLEIHPTGHYCPVRNATCRKCNATGNFKAVCDAKAKMAAIYVNQVSSAKDDTRTVSIEARGEPVKEDTLQRYTTRHWLNPRRHPAVCLPLPIPKRTTRRWHKCRDHDR